MTQTPYTEAAYAYSMPGNLEPRILTLYTICFAILKRLLLYSIAIAGLDGSAGGEHFLRCYTQSRSFLLLVSRLFT